MTNPLPPPVSTPGPFSPPLPPAPNSTGVPVPHLARWHTVQPGETLWKIAHAFYRKPSEWVRIYNANRDGVRRPDTSVGHLISTQIRPGERLHIP